MTFTPCTAHTWSDRGSVVGGIGMAAVALRDGSVLLCGGCSRSDYTVGTSHAWLCGTDSWISSLPAQMTRIRWGHSATLLNDGRVLIAGLGRARDADAQTAELYDPVKKTFTATGPMVQCRGWHAATLLGDGRVLLTGGLDSLGQPSASAELFDPATGSFSAAPYPMLHARAHHTATAVTGGCVLIVGDDSAELYAEVNGRFVSTAAPRARRHRHAAVALTDGRVLVAGGYSSGQPHAGTEEVWSPNNTWATLAGVGAAAGPRTWYGPTATRLADGRVLLTGGSTFADPFQFSPSISGQSFIVDAAGTQVSTLPGPANLERAFACAAALPSGQVVVAGGVGRGNKLPAEAKVYCPDPVPVELKLGFAGTGHGHVTSNPPGLDTAVASSAAFPAGSRVTLTARPAATRILPARGPVMPGRKPTPRFVVTHFDGWTGDATGSANPVTLTMTSTRTVTATFSEAEGTVQPKPPIRFP